MSDRDRTLISVERSDAIDAAGALVQFARAQRREAKLRRNGGPSYAGHRAWLRSNAAEYDAAAKRMQAAADAAF